MSDSSSRPAALQASVLGRATGTGAKSPTKGVPARAGLLRHSVDDVSYRQTDSTRSGDQAKVAGAGPHAELDVAAAPGTSSSDTHSKYMHLLSAVYTHGPGSNPRASATPAVAAPRVHATSTGAAVASRHQPCGVVAALPAGDGPAPPPLRSSASPKGVTGGSSKTGSSAAPVLRRSIRASILDSSQGSSLIPASPDSVAVTSAAAAASSSSRPQHLLSPSAGYGTSSKAVVGAQGVTCPTVLSRLRTSAGSTSGVSRLLQGKEPVSPIRRSTPTAAHPKPQYAFGSRIEPPPSAIKRRPSPSRVGLAPAAAAATSSQAARAGTSRTAASPQRVPSAARASAPGAASSVPFRSASAPRMSIADKAQSRFTQHAVVAAAAQRSKTPNPAQRAAAAAAAAVAANAAARSSGSGASAARRLRQTTQGAAPDSRHVGRMRASDSALTATQHSRLPGFSATHVGSRSPSKGSPAGLGVSTCSPVLRSGTGGRSVLAAAAAAAAGPGLRPGSTSKAIPAVPSSRVKAAATAAEGRLDRMALSLPGAGSIAADAGAQDCAAGVMVPVIKDRYKDLFKHTPAAIAVEEARAAAAAAAAAGRGGSPGDAAVLAEQHRPRGVAGVPKLALGGLTRQPSGEALAAPRGPTQQQQQEQPGHSHAADEAASPYLGRISGMAAAPAAVDACDDTSSALHKQPGGFGTPQQLHKPVVPLLALSTVTPVHRSRPGLAAEEGEAGPTFTPGAVDSCQQMPFSDVDLTPCPTATPAQDDTPSLLLRHQPRTDSSSKGGRGVGEEPSSPQLAPRNLNAGMQAAQDCSAATAASYHNAADQAPVDGTRFRGDHQLNSHSSSEPAAAGRQHAPGAKGFVLPTLQLQGAAASSPGSCFDSPPKHRRGERESPGGPAEVAVQHSLKAKANSVCSSSTTTNTNTRAHLAPHTAAEPGVRQGPPSGGKAAAAAGLKGRQRVGPAAGSVLEAAAEAPRRGRVVPVVRRSLQSGGASPSACAPAGGAGRRSLRVETPVGGHSGKCTPVCSPSKKVGTPVPRLDLTPVLASMAAEQQAAMEAHGEGDGLLLLEDAPRPRRLEMDGDTGSARDTHSGRQQGSGKAHASGGKPLAGSGKGRSGSGKGHGLSSNKKAAGPGSKGSQQSAEPPPQESYYVYESVMPPEEQRTYEELRRVLLKAPGGSKHVANLQGIWGCYQDARRNTEAMAFRGHRLLDQVSTEYGTFKRDAEVKLQQLEHERDEAREELQLAMVAGSVPATALQLAAKDKQVRELQEENGMLRQQVAEMEKALQMASDYHSATQAAHQAQQVPVHARVIAASATTNILTNLTLDQQMRLQQSEKRMEDMKAALHLACGVLRQTNYMDTHSELRGQLDPDTITVLDTIMATEEMEAGMAEAAAMQQQQQLMMQEGPCSPGMYGEGSPAVHIEEVHDVDVVQQQQ